ncbi:hypothetical protein FRX31_028722, partial [Thalictrum thalictroides]
MGASDTSIQKSSKGNSSMRSLMFIHLVWYCLKLFVLGQLSIQAYHNLVEGRETISDLNLGEDEENSRGSVVSNVIAGVISQLVHPKG